METGSIILISQLDTGRLYGPDDAFYSELVVRIKCELIVIFGHTVRMTRNWPPVNATQPFGVVPVNNNIGTHWNVSLDGRTLV